MVETWPPADMEAHRRKVHAAADRVLEISYREETNYGATAGIRLTTGGWECREKEPGHRLHQQGTAMAELLNLLRVK